MIATGQDPLVSSRALVLGGGGPVGIAWESGLAAGLEEAGVRLADADLIIGTSAGSVVGAQLALGRAPSELVAAQESLSENTRHPAQRSYDLAPLMQHFIKLYTSSESPEKLRAEIGAFAVAAATMNEEEWLASFGRLQGMGSDTWPQRHYMCTAVDASDGSFVTWDKDSGVPLGRAIASSCAVPGIFPPIALNGRRYIDGGMRSATNADLARGHDRVIVVSVTSSARASAMPQLMENMRRRFDAELDAIREAGGQVEVIVPDDGAIHAIGPNVMDPSRRATVAREGVRQGRNEATRLRDFWC
jgi:NTE family protein